MRTRIEKWGNSLAIRIPKPFAERAGLSVDTAVDLIMRQGSVVVTPVRKRPLLATLLRKVSPESLHGEIEIGEPIGREAGRR